MHENHICKIYVGEGEGAGRRKNAALRRLILSKKEVFSYFLVHVLL
jgi:hypothetical protein